MAPVPNDESGSTPEKPTELAAEILGLILLACCALLFLIFLCAIFVRSCASDIVGRWIKNCYTRAKSSLNTMRLKKARTDGAEPQNAVIMKLQYIPPPQSTHATTLPTPVPPVYK